MGDKKVGEEARSTAGHFGGDCVGKTNKSDKDIEVFNKSWLERHPTYDYKTTNCQKYAIDFIRWLTDDCYHLPYEPDAAELGTDDNWGNAIAMDTGKQAFAAAHLYKGQATAGLVGVNYKVLSADAEVRDGDRWWQKGAWANASVMRAETSFGPA